MLNLVQRTFYLQWTLYFCFFTLGVLGLTDSRLSAQRPPAPYLPEIAADLTDTPGAELIFMLGDDDYSIRIQAETELLKLTPDDLMGLIKNIQEEELEVQLRLTRLTEQARMNKFQRQIELFVTADKTVDEASIPGWLEFKKLFPEATSLRKEYAEMILNDYELFSEWENEQTRETALANRCFDITLGLDSGQSYRPRKTSTIRSLLYLTSLPDCKASTNVTNTIVSIVSMHFNRTNPNAHQVRFAPNFSEIDRVLLNHWVANAESVSDYNRFAIGNTYDLPGTVLLSKKMIKTVTDGTRLHEPICCLARLGDNSHIPDLIGLLKDERQAGPNFSNNPKTTKQLSIQVRDIALACLIHKTKQKLTDYGFNNIKDNGKTLFVRYSTNFADEDARTAAFKKWDAWAKDNLNNQGELIPQSDTKTSPKPVE